MRREPDPMGDEYLSTIFDSEPESERESAAAEEAPPAQSVSWNPDDVVGAITQWVKDGYLWEDIEDRVEEMFKQPRLPASPRPVGPADDEPDAPRTLGR